MDKTKDIVREWITKAENDYRACEILQKADNYPVDVLCFHCQQTVEKYLKAVLVHHQKRVKKIHDLEVLLDECGELVPHLKAFKDAVLTLDSFGPEARYPGQSDISREDIPDLRGKMETVRAAVRNYFEEAGVL